MTDAPTDGDLRGGVLGSAGAGGGAGAGNGRCAATRYDGTGVVIDRFPCHGDAGWDGDGDADRGTRGRDPGDGDAATDDRAATDKDAAARLRWDDAAVLDNGSDRNAETAPHAGTGTDAVPAVLGRGGGIRRVVPGRPDADAGAGAVRRFVAGGRSRLKLVPSEDGGDVVDLGMWPELD